MGHVRLRRSVVRCRLESTTDGAGATVTYRYDADGNVTCLSYPNSDGNTCQDVGSGVGIVTYVYNAAGENTSMTDWLGNTTSFSYDHDANVTSTTLPSGTDTTVADGYDDADNLNSVSITTSGTPTTLADLTRDADEDVTANSAGSGSSDDYDPLNQVTSAGSTSYAYDTADQLTSTTTGSDTTDYAYNSDGQLCWTGTSSGACSSPPSGATAYTYDTAGQRTTATPSSGDATTYGWSQAGTLTCETATNSSGYSCADPNSTVTSTYAYNGDGLRISDTPAGGSTQDFTWSTLGSTPQLLEDGTNFYLYGPNVGTAPIEQISISGSTPTYLVSDNTGVREQISNSGDVDGTNAYSAYGNCSSCDANTPFGYAGAYTDSTGFQYLINRYYDPTTGQFMSVDPLVILTKAPYSYANGDPMDNTDPLELWSLNPISDISEATSDVGEAVVSTVTNHWRGIVTGVGLVAGVAAAATGFGAIVEGSIALGLVSGGLGVVSGLADLPACIGTSGHHDGLACTGVAVGVGAGLLGGAGAFAGALVETGAVTANGVVDIYGGLSGAFGFAGGVGAVTFDGILGENGYLESCG